MFIEHIVFAKERKKERKKNCFHFLLFVEVEKAKFSLFKTFDELNLPIFVSLPNVGRYQHPPFDSLRGFVFVALS